MGTTNTQHRMSSMYIEGQDWNTVVLSKRPAPAKTAEGAASGPLGKEGKRAASIDHATEAMKIETAAPLDLRVKLQQARTAKKMTQANLAKAINKRPADIQAYEAGKAKPDGATLNKISKVLGAKLSTKK